jgi:hypothetical protein
LLAQESEAKPSAKEGRKRRGPNLTLRAPHLAASRESSKAFCQRRQGTKGPQPRAEGPSPRCLEREQQSLLPKKAGKRRGLSLALRAPRLARTGVRSKAFCRRRQSHLLTPSHPNKKGERALWGRRVGVPRQREGLRAARWQTLKQVTGGHTDSDVIQSATWEISTVQSAVRVWKNTIKGASERQIEKKHAHSPSRDHTARKAAGLPLVMESKNDAPPFLRTDKGTC